MSFIIPVQLRKIRKRRFCNLRLLLYKGQFQLSFGRVFYSDGTDYFPFKKSLTAIKGHLTQIDKVLILGAGIGSAAMILNEMFPDKLWQCTFVDIDEDVLSLCQDVIRCFPNVKGQFVQEDAWAFLDNETRKYKLICFDIFDEHVVPKKFLTEAFLKKLRNSMLDEGIAIMNLMFASPIQEEGFKSLVRTYFPKFDLISTSKNQIFILYAL